MLSQSLFFIAYLMTLPTIFMVPFAGVVMYEWLQYLPPYDIYYAPPEGNFSLIVGLLALFTWIGKDKKEKPAAVGLITLFAIYIIWVNITQATTIMGDMGVSLWERALKMLVFTFFLCFMMQTRARLEAFIWVLCLAIGNFVFSGAIKTILSGGGGETVVGGAANIIGDRVYFAAVVSAVIPLGRYLRDNATLVPFPRYVRLFVDGFTIACLLSIIGCQARTGVLCLGVLGVFYFFKSKKKFLYILSLPFLLGIMYYFAPPEWFGRMDTMNDLSNDASVQGRFDSWQWGWNFTLDHPIVGGGFHSFAGRREAHNMYVETMADHGFPGLGMLVLLQLGTYLNCQIIRSRTRKIPELSWARDLAGMIQLAEVTFIVGSMAISDSTLSLGFEFIALTVGLRGIVERHIAAAKPVFQREELQSVRTVLQPAPALVSAAGAVGFRR